LFDLQTRLGAPTSLSSLGLKHGDLGRRRTRGCNAYSESAPLDLAIRELLDKAFEGVRPAASAGRETLVREFRPTNITEPLRSLPDE